ncbi:F-box protein At1g11270-like [Lolium perenne]|uniref:F-box protein At1g11270-like n=1 Tax=Lolium perenne TaxID=4522 RepID=UPI003A99BBE4
MAIDMDSSSVSLPYHAVFEILSRTPVKSVCRFRCVSKGWRRLISSPVFAAAHRSRHGPLLVDGGSFPEEEPDGGRDVRLMDTDGNVVRVLRGVGGYGMICSTSLDDLICVNGASCGGVSVVDPATGEVLLTCPQVDVVEHDAFPYVAVRYYPVFGFGRAAASGEYKIVRVVNDSTCEILTLGDGGNGWRKTQPPPTCCRPGTDRGSPVTVNGVMYFLIDLATANDDTLLCLDLESEQWKPDVLGGPRELFDMEEWEKILAVRITELNGALCVVQPVCDETRWDKFPEDPFTNIWLLDDSGKSWIKAYRIPMAASASRYTPLRVMPDTGKVLLQCSLDCYFDKEPSVVLRVYDPRTGSCVDVTGAAPDDLAGRIGLCSFGLDHPVSGGKSLLARFFDQASLFFSKKNGQEAMEN